MNELKEKLEEEVIRGHHYVNSEGGRVSLILVGTKSDRFFENVNLFENTADQANQNESFLSSRDVSISMD